MTLIAASIAVDRPDAVSDALAGAARAKADGADLVEWRLDSLAAETGAVEAARRLVRESPMPCIVTVRAAAEGGGWDGDETDRISFLEAVCTSDHPPRYIDVELSSLERSANLRQKVLLCVDHPGQVRDGLPGLIVSAHDFTGRPDDLTRRVAQMWQDPACAVAKVAWRARSLRDVTEAIELLAMRSKPTAAICMGDFGLMTRVLAPKFGAFLTYAHAGGDGATAPGQPSVGELAGTWRFRGVGRGTSVYGVIGWPVAQSRSPEIHNAWFAAHGIDARYVPLPVAPGWESFKATVSELRACTALGFRGASVTHPHKEHLLRYALECGGQADDASMSVGAANTMALGLDGSVRALNTDAPAVAEVMRGLARQGSGWRGAHVAVIGAGGAARAAAYAMSHEGSDVTILARRPEQAVEAAAGLGVRDAHASSGARAGSIAGGALHEIATRSFDAIINATPVGMRGGPDESASPLPGDASLKPGMAVLDMVSVPEETPLVTQARSRGVRVATGMTLLVAQARRQFLAWTGTDPHSTGGPAPVSARVVRSIPIGFLCTALIMALCAAADPCAVAAVMAPTCRAAHASVRAPALGMTSAHVRAPVFGMRLDPILFEEVRAWCGERISIAVAEWPDVCAAHRDYLAAWAAAERQRPAGSGTGAGADIDARLEVDGAFLDRLGSLLGDEAAPALEPWRRARRCAMAEQLAREAGGAVDALGASARGGVPFELRSAVSAYARISEDSARALAQLRSRADAGEDVDGLRSAERGIRAMWLSAEASLAEDCAAAGPAGEAVLRAMLAGAYPDLVREWASRAQLMRAVVARMPALDPRARDAALASVDAYTRARWTQVEAEVLRRRASASRRAPSASRSVPSGGEPAPGKPRPPGSGVETLLAEEDAALLAALADSVGAERAQAIRTLAYAQLTDSMPTIARIVGEDGAVEVMEALPRDVASEVVQRGETPSLRAPAYALPDSLASLRPVLEQLGARILSAQAKDDEDRRALDALARDDSARWSRDVAPALAQLSEARARAEQAVRAGDLAMFDGAASSFVAIGSRCLDAVVRHDGETLDALERLAARPDGVPAWVRQIRLARALEVQAPRSALVGTAPPDEGEPVTLDLRALAMAIADPDAWGSLDPSARALLEGALGRALSDGTPGRRMALDATIASERSRIGADLALRDVDALVRQHGSPPAGDPAAFAIQQARMRSASAGTARAQAASAAVQAEARAALSVIRALEDSVSRAGSMMAGWQARRFLVSGALASGVPEWSAARALLMRSERAAWCDALDGESARPAAELWAAALDSLGQSAQARTDAPDPATRIGWRLARGQLEQSAQRTLFLAGLPGLRAPSMAVPGAGSQR